MPDRLDFDTINFTRYDAARKNVIRAVAAIIVALNFYIDPDRLTFCKHARRVGQDEDNYSVKTPQGHLPSQDSSTLGDI